MRGTLRARRFWLAGALILAAALVAVPAGGGKTNAPRGDSGPFKVVLSNNFLGNDWRPQMERLAELTAQQAPFRGKITLQIVNSETTTQAQIASLNNIIASEPDAILIDAGSPTALNPTVERACRAGIKVISFDQPVTAPCAYRVYQDHGIGQRAVGQWMAKVLKKQGGIFVDRGLPGAPISAIIHDNFLAGLRRTAPGVKVVAEYDGKYAIGPTQQAVSSLLAGNSDVAGVHTQGYCTAAFNAFKNAGKTAVPTTCYGYNGELVACARQKVPCAVLSGSTVVVQIAMKLALDALQDKKVPPTSKVIRVPWTLYLTGPRVSLSNVGGKVEYVKLGKNAFPALAPGLALPYTLPQYKISAQQAAAKRK